MTLNAQERAAVERTNAWMDETEYSPAEKRVSFAFGEIDPCSPLDALREGFACGHLSGFRAGVEAAAELFAGDAQALAIENPGASAMFLRIRDRIRALLAQEDEHGS